jgi:hypothetical protein
MAAMQGQEAVISGQAAEQPTAQTANIYVLHYDGVVTGSKELRAYNQHVVSKEYNNPNTNKPINKIMKYFEIYDNSPGGKKSEPFFDAFLVHLAHMSSDQEKLKGVGLDGINYYPVKIYDSEEENKGWESKFRSSRMGEEGPAIQKIPNYDNAKHIFILSPMTPVVLQKINKYINDIKETTEKLIFHIQGDVLRAPDGKLRYEDSKTGDPIANPDSGMTGGGSMFGEAFNLFTGGIEFQEFRNKLKSVSAEFYSVSPVCTDKSSFDDVPYYYKIVNLDLLQACSGNEIDKTKFKTLDISYIAQDGVDKDNLASIALIGKMDHKNLPIPIDFVGFRIYESSTRPFGHPDSRSSDMHFDFKKVPLPEYATATNGFRQNPKTGEWEKPCDMRGPEYGNFKYLPEDTLIFYGNQMRGFMEYLNIVVPERKFQWGQGGIADGIGEFSNSLRCPFNMTLFYFATDTYMDFGVGANSGAAIKGQENVELQQSKRLKPATGGGEIFELIPLVYNL